MGKSPGVGLDHLFGENTLWDTFTDDEMNSELSANSYKWIQEFSSAIL